MISWLLVAVLLFAVDAITTPTSTLAEPRFTSTQGPAVTLRKQTGDNRDKGSPLSAVDGPGLAQIHNGTSTIVGPSPDGPASLSRGGDHLAAISAGNLSIFNHQVGQAADTLIDSAQSRHRNRSEATSWAPTQPVSEQRTFSPGATSNRSDEDGASKRGTPLQEQQSQPDTSSKSAPESQQRRQKKVYTNQFVIKVEGGEEEARRVAEKHGFIYLNHIIDNFYHLEHRRLAKRSLDAFDMDSLDVSIEEEPNVLTFERQLLKRRVKRDFIDLGTPPPPGMGRANQLRPHPNGQQRQTMQALRPAARPAGSFLRPANQAPFGYQQHAQLQAGGALQHAQDTRRPQPYQQLLDQLEMNSSGPAPFFAHANHSGAANINKHRPPPPPIQMSAPSAELQRNNQTFHYANDTRRQAPFNDPSWPLMWYLDGGARNGFDLNVQAAWRMGYTGRGIVITILDDGLEKDHPDLQANYDPMASFDINGDDADPMPRYDSSDSNRHGTRCAGEVAAVPNNNICSIGIAYNSKVGGVRMLDGEVTDAVEARSLRLNNQHIHIYSASWGPDDNGKTVDGPGELATRAFVEGVTRGRGGRGSIFVFASGNGGREHDNCNCDGYTNSIWTLSISSASENGFVPWYIEACSSTLATTYSSGSFDERQIATTDIRHSCTNNHTGTSASAPIAAGICALVLEANPELTWRDMQHIVVRTAKPANLVARDWRTNAMGRNVSHAFGYGLMDAAAMILMAKRWRNVPDAYTCLVEAPRMEKHIQSKGVVEIKLRVECSKIHFIEHVQAVITLTAVRRGDLHIYLTSPRGTRSTLLAQRPMDIGEQGFRKWPFMTVHNWGEPPNGIWTLEVHNDGKPPNRATLREWNLTLYGTEEDPNMNTDFSYLSNQQQPSFMSAAHPQTTTTTSPTTTTSTSTTPSPREQIKTQHSIGNQPPAPSFSPTDYDMQTGRPAVNRKPIVSISGDMQTMVQSSPPPPPVGHKVPAVSRPIDTTPSTTTASSRQQQLFSQTVAPATTSTSSSVSSSTTTIATSSEVQYENAKQTPESEILTPKTNKADFEVVAPPTIAVGNQHHSPDPFLANNRPQIQVMDGNKIDASQTGGRPFAPEVVRATTPRPLSGQPQPTPNQNEFDTNQLDAKFTKDYRSSGGGSLQDVPYEEDDTRQNGADSTLSGKAADPLNRQRPSAAKDRSNSAPLAGVSMSVHFFGLLIGCLFVLDRQRRIESPFRAVSAR